MPRLDSAAPLRGRPGFWLAWRFSVCEEVKPPLSSFTSIAAAAASPPRPSRADSSSPPLRRARREKSHAMRAADGRTRTEVRSFVPSHNAQKSKRRNSGSESSGETLRRISAFQATLSPNTRSPDPTARTSVGQRAAAAIVSTEARAFVAEKWGGGCLRQSAPSIGLKDIASPRRFAAPPPNTALLPEDDDVL